jgi:3-oxoacyl-(acyl-carrier-protein) synthase
MPRGEVAVTGVGIISALGSGRERNWSAILREESGLGTLTLFQSRRCGSFPVAEVKEDFVSNSLLRRGSRSDYLAVSAAAEAFEDAKLDTISNSEREGIGVILGASTGGMLDTEVFLTRLIRENNCDAELLRFHECSSSTEAVARILRLGGYRSTVSTACTSGAAAIAAACDVLLSGEADIMLAGGVDSLTRLTLNGFASLLIMSPDGCRPFDSDRNGMSLGEGAAVLVLESEDSVRSRGAKVYAYVAGWGGACDAYHATAPSPEGKGIVSAMRRALEMAEMSPEEIQYINAHGTGTQDNDIAEAKAMRTVFGEALPLVSSTKRYFGHTLAAAGAIESAVCVMALENQCVPPNLGIRKAIAELGCEPVMKPTKVCLEAVMKNCLGFGGGNTSIIFVRG